MKRGLANCLIVHLGLCFLSSCSVGDRPSAESTKGQSQQNGALLSSDRIELFEDFQNSGSGLYDEAAFLKDWNTEPTANSGVQSGRLSIVEDDAEKALRVTYLAQKIGGKSASVFAQLWTNKNYTDLWLQYEVKFPENFTWVKGGKLPGLAGYLGEVKPTGCVSNAQVDGFSARFMWREGGQVLQYLYHPEKKNRCGDYHSLGKFFQKGRWHTITSFVRLNDVGKHNGIAKSYLDGELLLELDSLNFRSNKNITINSLLFETFFGGGSMSWAPQSDQYAYFDNIIVAQESPLAFVRTKPYSSIELTDNLKQQATEWKAKSSYAKGTMVYLHENGETRYFQARSTVGVNVSPLQNSIPVHHQKIYGPDKLDKGELWLEYK